MNSDIVLKKVEGWADGLMLDLVVKKRSPATFVTGLFKIWRRPTLPHVTAVPSALAGLTSLFGMGRGGHRRYRHLNIFKVYQLFVGSWVGRLDPKQLTN